MLDEIYEEIEQEVAEYTEKKEKAKNEEGPTGFKMTPEERQKRINQVEQELKEQVNDKMEKYRNKLKRKAKKQKKKVQEFEQADNTEKTYKATVAGQEIEMLDNEEIPKHLKNIDDPTKRKEFVRLAQLKLRDEEDTKLQKEFNQSIRQSLPEEEKEARENLAYKQQLLENFDRMQQKANRAVNKIINEGDNFGEAFKQEKLQNLSHSWGDTNEQIKNNLDKHILKQF